jgi:hypothetical protein
MECQRYSSVLNILATYFSAVLGFILVGCSNWQEVDYITMKHVRPFNVPDLHLKYFSEQKKEDLIDFLSKSSQWHVFPLHGTIIAIRRNDAKTCEPIMESLPSWYSDQSIPGLKNNYLNFFPHVYQPPRLGTRLYNYALENSEISLTMKHRYRREQKPPLVVPWNSSLVIRSESKGIELNVFEESDDTMLNVTKRYLNLFKSDVGKMLQSTSLRRKDDLTSALPKSSFIMSGKESFSVKGVGKTGLLGSTDVYIVSGFVNRGKKGFVYLKLLTKDNKEGTNAEKEGTNAEYVGWSEDPNKKFNFCLGFRNIRNTLKPSETLPLEFQVWFKPSDNSPEELLYTETAVEKGY